jgi:hypothetical protein
MADRANEVLVGESFREERDRPRRLVVRSGVAHHHEAQVRPEREKAMQERARLAPHEAVLEDREAHGLRHRPLDGAFLAAGQSDGVALAFERHLHRLSDTVVAVRDEDDRALAPTSDVAYRQLRQGPGGRPS